MGTTGITRTHTIRRVLGTLLLAVCCTAPCARAHETSWARPARGLVFSVDRISDTIVFLPDAGSEKPWMMDLETSASYWENGKAVSSLSLKRGMRVEVFYRTPIFGNRFIAKVVWDRDTSVIDVGAAEPESTVADSGGKPNTVSGVWVSIHRQFEALGNSIGARQLTAVPASTAAIRDLASTLPQLGLAARQSRGKLTNHLALVGQWTRRIEAAAAKADQASVEASYKKLKKTLRSTASLYPP